MCIPLKQIYVVPNENVSTAKKKEYLQFAIAHKCSLCKKLKIEAEIVAQNGIESHTDHHNMVWQWWN